jgi:hypothetical protein
MRFEWKRCGAFWTESCFVAELKTKSGKILINIRVWKKRGVIHYGISGHEAKWGILKKARTLKEGKKILERRIEKILTSLMKN